MPARSERALERWLNAGLIDAATAERIRAFEHLRAGAAGLRWSTLVALAFGGLMLGAGVLLLVAASWDNVSPPARFALVLPLVVVFHAGGALAARRFENLAITLHGVGTCALGAGIFLAAQVFYLESHWPSGIMLWAAGAWMGYALRRDWVQLALAAILTPYWLAGEWVEAASPFGEAAAQVLGAGLLLLAITYFAARTGDTDGAVRRALAWIGGLALIPCAAFLATHHTLRAGTPATSLLAAGWVVAFGVPLALALFLRRRMAWVNAVAGLWVLLLGLLSRESTGPLVYLWLGAGCCGMVSWGVYAGRHERINLGIAGFAITVLSFYFSNVMDKLGRSASLIGLGLLFLAGGWALEKARRRLVARVEDS